MSSLCQKITAAVVGVGAASILSAGIAHAAPTPVHGPPPKTIPKSTPIPGANCTYGQAEKALAKQDPKVWAKITKDDHYRSHFQQDIVRTKAQREAKAEEWRKAHPVETVALEAAERAGVFGDPVQSAKDRATFGEAIDRARANCAKF
ncbi:hypothetical protein GOARA_031_00170 [Gordonia araii NBRC 100433]|uniref:Uncharacterized protein n=1 Tax=Gordonia araii NBRC 100433 TaxID=1073574 RepID=G7H017_9ACTN|nr:hypothetical protein [Gordonia araii]NNG98800.1 hypothetical protein [Gordonia araii NBRC 100433]GAB09192.1 hypothetical protein GOARA_031_00170 [Gordonia araii NBRC 100433]